jgi:hypothetical protein
MTETTAATTRVPVSIQLTGGPSVLLETSGLRSGPLTSYSAAIGRSIRSTVCLQNHANTAVPSALASLTQGGLNAQTHDTHAAAGQ